MSDVEGDNIDMDVRTSELTEKIGNFLDEDCHMSLKS